MAINANTIQIALLPAVAEWPTRKLPQSRFDEQVKTAMNQMSGMIVSLNENFIPNANKLGSQVITNAQEAAASASAAKTSENAAKASENAAKTSESNAKTSEKAVNSALNKANADMDAILDAANADMAANLIEAKGEMNSLLSYGQQRVDATAQKARESADASAQSARESKESAADSALSAQEAKASTDEFYNLQIVVEESLILPGSAELKRDENTLLLRIPRGKTGLQGPPGPAGDITTAIESSFFQFVVEDGDLTLKWAGNPPATSFAINENGELEVQVA